MTVFGNVTGETKGHARRARAPTALAAAALAASIVGAAPAAAEEISLIFATATPPTAASNTQFYRPWSERLNAAGKGVFKIDFRGDTSIANLNNVLDRVINDVAQIGWTLHSIYGQKFRLTSVSFLPFAAEDSTSGAIALWRLYKTGMLDADYAETVPLVLNLQGQSRLHFAKPPKTFEELSGLKVVASGKMYSDSVMRLGGAPVTVTLADMYEALNRRTVDAVMMGWGGVGSYKLFEVSNYHVEVPLGASSSMIFMERKRYNALPEAARKAIDAESGEAASRALGEFSDRELETQRNLVKAMPNQTIVFPTPEQYQAMERRLAPIVDEWVRDTPNGAAILAAWKKLFAEAKAAR
jgi:TRAP-type C4-dicarboxylate transport system substrate-binding protein